MGCAELGSTVVVGELPDEVVVPEPELEDPSDPSDPGSDEPTDVDQSPCNGGIDFGADQCDFYLSASPRGLANGRRWTDASACLRQALEVGRANRLSGSCDTVNVFIGVGTFVPDVDDPTQSFRLFADLRIEGGHLETEDNQRSLVDAITRLHGGPQEAYHILEGVGSGVERVALDGVTIEGGYARGSDQDSQGGALHIDGLILELVDVVIQANRAVDKGGALWMKDGQLIESRVRWANNHSAGGGGAVFAKNSRAYPYFAEYVSNTTEGNGGALYLQESPEWSIQRAHFENNQAMDGGALYVDAGDDIKVCRTFFIRNIGQGGGGAMSVSRTRSVRVASSVFTGNQASRGASLVGDSISSGSVTNVTMNQNVSAEEPNLVLTGPDRWTFENSILWQNGIVYEADVEPVFRTNIVDATFNGGEGNLSEDPRLRSTIDQNADTWDLSLRSDSPAIDAGDSSLIEADFCNQDVDAEARVVGASVDIGAYEFRP